MVCFSLVGAGGRMNISKRDLFKSFYSKRIYFFHQREAFKEEVVELKTLRELLSINCKDWENTPLSYLSSREALSTGIMIYVKKGYLGEKHICRAIELCQHAFMETKDKELSFLASMALGILYFECALLQKKKEAKENFFKTSAAYLKTANDIAPEDDHSCLYHAIVQRGRGQNLEAVAKTLIKASKLSPVPSPIYKILINIYSELEMEQAALFYRNKSELADMEEALLVA